MSTEATDNGQVTTIDLLAPALPDESKGSGKRFDELLKKATEVREDVPPAKKEPAEKRVEVTVDKDGIPDFSKKLEAKKTEEVVAPNHDEELKAHPSVKGEAAKSFKAILAQRDEFKAAADKIKADYEAKLAELSSKTSGVPKEVEEKLTKLQQDLKDREEALGKAHYSNSPKFQASLTAEKQELAAAQSYMDGDDAKQQAIEMAANLSGKKRIAALNDAGMSSDEIAIVGANLARVDQLRRERAADIENWKQSSELDQQSVRAKQAQDDAKRREYEDSVFSSLLSKATSEDGLPGFQKRDGYEDWNKDVDTRIATGKRLFNGEADLPEIGKVLIDGLALPAQQKLYAKLETKYNALAQELANLKAAANPNGAAKTDKAGVTQQEGGTAASRFDATLAGYRGQ